MGAIIKAILMDDTYSMSSDEKGPLLCHLTQVVASVRMTGSCETEVYLAQNLGCTKQFFGAAGNKTTQCLRHFHQMVACQMQLFRDCYEDNMPAFLFEIVISDVRRGYYKQKMDKVLCSGEPFLIVPPREEPGRSRCSEAFFVQSNAQVSRFLKYLHEHGRSLKLCRYFYSVQQKLDKLEKEYCREGFMAEVRTQVGWFFSQTQNPFC